MNLQIEIENYKSIRHTTIDLKPGLNILIGANGSGKTNILSSLKFIKDILLQGAGIAIAKGGGQSRVYYRGQNTIRIKISFDYGPRVYRMKKRETNAYWSIEVSKTNKENIGVISHEHFKITSNVDGIKTPLFELQFFRKKIHDQLSGVLTVNKNEDLGKDLFNAFLSENRKLKKSDIINEVTKEIKENIRIYKRSKTLDKSYLPSMLRFDYKFQDLMIFFTELNEYNIIPNRARLATEQVPYSKMEPDGFGISEVINSLQNRDFDKLDYPSNPDYSFDSELFYWQYRRRFFSPFGFGYSYRRYGFHRRESNLTSALRNINKELSAAVKPITAVSVDIDRSNGKRFVIFKSLKKNINFYPDEVSDGTMKWVCILTGIYVGLSKVFLLEEPENFLHPWMQQKLIQIMRNQSELDKTVYILTSHSTTILNSAKSDEVITVRQLKNGTVAKRIGDEDEVVEFLQNSEFRLGDLWVSGGIEAIPE